MFINNPKVIIRTSILLNIALILYIAVLNGWHMTNSSLYSTLSGSENIQHFSGYDCDLCPKCNSPIKPEEEKIQLRRQPPLPAQNTTEYTQTDLPIPQQPPTQAPIKPTSSIPTPLTGAPHIVSKNVTCLNKDLSFRQALRGKYWILYNYIPAAKTCRCNESITYTTHGDFTFMDNLEPLLKRWEGPASIAVYSPGSDYKKTVDTILYYRDCSKSSLVKDFVTFHLFFDVDHIPPDVIRYKILQTLSGNCSNSINWGEGYQTYRKTKELDYPVNVARNVARETVQTHFIFPSDIELYPSPGTIPRFLEMIWKDDTLGSAVNPRVYVNSIFEIQANATLPNTKTELLAMLGSGVVIPFHKHVCPSCHSVPNAKGWKNEPVKPGMSVSHVGKRLRPFHHWEPIYIGTNQEPFYDERLSWEGRSDKMTQGFTMCVLDYEFHILDNAFLIHRPGIKTKKTLHLNNKKVAAQNTLIKKKIFPELKKLFGTRKGCEMW